MNRDISERIDSTITESKGLKRAIDPIDRGLNRLFQSRVLHPVKLLLNGSWLGHPLHPALTDLPVGAWTVAILLDLGALVFHTPTGRAASVAVAIGLVGALGSALSGLMDWLDVNPPEKAVGAVHALLNVSGTILFAVSLAMRANRHWHVSASAFGVAAVGYLLVMAGAYLGGSLVFRMGAMINRNAFRSGPEDFASALPSSDLPEGELKRVTVADEPVLLLRRGEKIFAVGAICSHYGAPLEEGKLLDGVIECPWHFSRFALEDGRVRQGPACAPLPAYEVRVAGGQIQVRRRA